MFKSFYFDTAPIPPAPAPEPEECAPLPADRRAARRQFSKIGFGLFALLVAGSITQSAALALANLFWPGWAEHSWGIWLITFAPLYLIGIPVGFLVLRAAPARPLAKHSLKLKKLLLFFAIGYFMLYAGNLTGILTTSLLQLLPGLPAENPILGYATDDAFLPKFLVMVILAPLIEEFIFRKVLIDRMHAYGERLAVVVSAILFGLFHGNLSQLFYAAGLGLVLGYVYLKTGRLRYTFILHAVINFLGGIVAPLFLEKTAFLESFDWTALEGIDWAAMVPDLLWLLAYGLYTSLLMGLAVTGLVLLCVKRRKISFAPAELELPGEGRFPTVWLNVGMIFFAVLCFWSVIFNLL